ncbi:PREDICTED: leucine-rich repeat-containing protein 74B-like [Ceratosolen solmsi marchali]|uniref:Leucine-rich repeat-containing protein 74B-like n=1 Tax=Ceratosolen solmsi marchali TaxID=326594 RepID=A0AAJ7DU62_9HYME|nr:PREDICTED: leucine-rich repeat-containing protein 74B-like [Ceratosolen solmsi marchali]
MEIAQESHFIDELNKSEWEDHDKWSDSDIKSSDSFGSRRFNETDDEKTILSISSGQSETFVSPKTKNDENVLTSDIKESILRNVEIKLSNLHKFYPVSKDSGLKSAFWILYPNPRVYKSDGVELFFDLVKSLNLIPISCLRQQLKSDTVSLKHYCIDPKIIQPLVEALLKNTTVKNLDLQFNCLTASACYHLSKLLFQNTTLCSLNLTACKIGESGAVKLKEGIKYSPNLRDLNLSGCELGSKGLYYIVKAVSVNSLLQNLNISNNKKLFSFTQSLISVNLSWNSLHTKIASEAIYKGLAENLTTTDIDLSWNSIGNDSFPYIGYLVANTKYIKRLNLTANRLTSVEGLKIANALLANRCLEELELSKNPLGSQGVSEFLQMLISNDFIYCPLLLLNFEDLWVTKDTLSTLTGLKEIKPDLNIKIGGILENYKIKGPNLKELFLKAANHEAMSCKKKKDRKNFGIFILSLEDSIISKEDFMKILRDAKIRISDNLAKEIMNQFLVTKHTINQEELKISYKFFFPNTKLPDTISVAATDKTETNTKKKKKKSKRKKGRKGKRGTKGKRGKRPKKGRKLRLKKKISKRKGKKKSYY